MKIINALRYKNLNAFILHKYNIKWSKQNALGKMGYVECAAMIESNQKYQKLLRTEMERFLESK